jgi:hypothetical protein
MIHRTLPYDPTLEDQLTRAKWARGFGIVYGTIFLLLLAIAAAHHFRVEHPGATTIANEPAAEPMRTDLRTITIGATTALQPANTASAR